MFRLISIGEDDQGHYISWMFYLVYNEQSRIQVFRGSSSTDVWIKFRESALDLMQKCLERFIIFEKTADVHRELPNQDALNRLEGSTSWFQRSKPTKDEEMDKYIKIFQTVSSEEFYKLMKLSSSDDIQLAIADLFNQTCKEIIKYETDFQNSEETTHKGN